MSSSNYQYHWKKESVINLLCITILMILKQGYGQIDLSVSSVDWGQEQIYFNEEITFSIIIENNGLSVLDSDAQILLLFHRNEHTDTVALLCQDRIEPGSNTQIGNQWTALPEYDQITVVIDPKNEIIESNEQNNSHTTNFTVLHIDYNIVSIEKFPQVQINYRPQQLRLWVINRGNMSCVENSLVEFFVNDSSIGTQRMGPCDSGDSVSVTFDWVARPGKHEFRASCDIENELLESDETNNTFIENYTSFKTDLTFGRIIAVPLNPNDGEMVTFYAEIINDGQGGDTTNYSVAMLINGEADTNRIINDINLGQRKIPFHNADFENGNTVNWGRSGYNCNIDVVDKGIGTIYGPFDSNKYLKMAEARFAHNSSFLTSWLFDITDTIICFDAAGFCSKEVRLNIIGSDDYKRVFPNRSYWQSFVWDVRDYIGETAQIQLEISPCGLGRLSQIKFDNLRAEFDSTKRFVTDVTSWRWRALGGVHRVFALLDINNEVDETNEHNQVSDTILLSVAQPDYTIERLDIDTSNIALGRAIPITLVVSNIGMGISSQYAALALIVNETDTLYQSFSRLDSQSQRNFTFQWYAKPGTFRFSAIADVNNSVAESDEDNNRIEATHTVSLPYPDFSIHSLVVPPDWVNGNYQQLSFTLQNNSTIESIAPELKVYFNDSLIVHNFSVNAQPGESRTYSFTSPSAANPYTIRLVCDEDNEIIESDESNNSISKTIIPSLPDLRFDRITWIPENPRPGDEITLYLPIVNVDRGGSNKDYSVLLQGSNLQSEDTLISSSVGPGLRSAPFINAGFEDNSTTNWNISEVNTIVSLKKRPGAPFDSVYASLNQEISSYQSSSMLSNQFLITDSIVCIDVFVEDSAATNIYLHIQDMNPSMKIRNLRENEWSTCVFSTANYIGDSASIGIYSRYKKEVRFDNLRMERYINSQHVCAVYSYSWVAASGQQVFTATVDAEHAVHESNEANNTAELIIPEFTINTPSKDTLLYAETSFTINWESTNAIRNVAIDYSIDSGASWTELVHNTSNDGFYEWRVPKVESDKCLLKIKDIYFPHLSFDIIDSVFTITIPIEIPHIISQPVSQFYTVGDQCTLSVNARGENLHYQWLRDGIAIENADSNFYLTPALTKSDDNAYFQCRIENIAGSVLSTKAVIQFREKTGNIVVSGLSDSTRVYLGATNSWIGNYLFSGNDTIKDIQAGLNYMAIESDLLQSELIPVNVIEDSITTISPTLNDVVPLVFGDIVSYLSKDNIQMQVNDMVSAVFEDFDADMDFDLLAGFWNGNIIVYTNTENLFQESQTIHLDKSSLVCFRYGDFNTDNYNDILAGFQDGTLALYSNNKDGQYIYEGDLLTAPGTLYSFDINNFDTDSLPEILLGLENGTVYKSKFTETLWNIEPVYIENQVPIMQSENVLVSSMDVTGDGKNDIICGGEGDSLAVYSGSNSSTFVYEGFLSFNGKPFAVSSISNIFAQKPMPGNLPIVHFITVDGFLWNAKAKIKGDFNDDGIINLIDFGLFVDAWRLTEKDEGWNSVINIDVTPRNELQVINLVDFSMFVELWQNSIK